MKRDELIAIPRQAAPALKAEGVSGLAIFGSRARGSADEGSDLDLLIEVDAPRFSPLNLIGVEHIATNAAGLRSQAAMRRSLDPGFARRIADDVIKVF